MGRKKKKPVKPWCWYCNREFDDDKILVQHQRAKHFKCPLCHKKLYSGPGLTVHCIQVHKEKLDKIPEALPNRNSIDIDIYGMQGVPEEDLRQHERLKRGVPEPDNKSINESNQHSSKGSSSKQTQLTNQANPAYAAMQAAMFQHALGVSPMPPGYPIQPGMSTATGLPPGFPPMGYPGPIQPVAIPPPQMIFNLGVPPPAAPIVSSAYGFPMRTQGPSTSTLLPPPPPPLSGVGHLIGVPPPGFGPPPPPPPPPVENDPPPASTPSFSSSHDRVNRRHENEDRVESHAQSRSQRALPSNPRLERQQDLNLEDQHSDSRNNESSTTSIKREPCANISDHKFATLDSNDFIELQGSTARIMHPNKDLSLEELRLNLKRYQSFVRGDS